MQDSFEVLVARARGTNRLRDAVDRDAGLAVPSEVGIIEIIGTAHAALECALRLKDWECAAEAFVFLDDVLNKPVAA